MRLPIQDISLPENTCSFGLGVIIALLLCSCNSTPAAKSGQDAGETSISQATRLPELVSESNRKLTAMWRLHKRTYLSRERNYNYSNDTYHDTTITKEEFPEHNEFLNLLDSNNVEFKGRYENLEKGIWFVTFGEKRNGAMLSLLHLAFNKEKTLRTYLVSFESRNGVNFLVLDNISDDSYDGGKYYYTKQQ